MGEGLLERGSKINHSCMKIVKDFSLEVNLLDPPTLFDLHKFQEVPTVCVPGNLEVMVISYTIYSTSACSYALR